MITKDGVACKVENQSNSDLLDGLADDHLAHVHVEQWC